MYHSVSTDIFSKALFTRREGNPGPRVTLALAYFFFFTRVYKAGRVTFARVTQTEC